MSPKRILIRLPNPVGDLVMATGCLEAVRRSHPDAHITWLLKPGREAIVDGSQAFDEILVDDSHKGWSAFWSLRRKVREGRYDLAVLTTHALRTALLLALARVPVRIGHPKGGQSPFLTKRVRPEKRSFRKWKPVPMPRLYAKLFEAADVAVDDSWPKLVVTPECEARYAKRRSEFGIGEDERLIGIVPGAAFGASKLWPADRIAALADRVSERYDCRTMIFAGPAEAEIVAQIKSAMKSTPLDALDNPPGLDLLKPFIRDLRCLITMDTGPRHYATAFRVPTLCIMGPTDPEWTNEHLDLQDVVRRDVPCGPCHKPICPLDHRCMTEIEVAEVLARLEALQDRVGGF